MNCIRNVLHLKEIQTAKELICYVINEIPSVRRFDQNAYHCGQVRNIFELGDTTARTAALKTYNKTIYYVI